MEPSGAFVALASTSFSGVRIAKSKATVSMGSWYLRA